ncbi:MAG TPA: hypothetical protein DDY98_06410 [Ruminococcaceae bacterium]|nr:hypothetical protein [Oscillospiraceae bacterium]
MTLKQRLLLFLVLTVCIGFAVFGTQKAADSKQADGCVYWIKEYNGMVAVFETDSQMPQEVLDCPINSLPTEEAERIQSGIPVSSEEELQQLIEAFD